jgi:hypothetical protein
MKKGYLYACCQTENGAYVYQGDYIRTNQGNLYRVLSLYVHYFHGEGTVFVYVSDLATRNRASVPLNEIHGLCDFASEDSLIGKKVSIISGKGAELDRE